MTSAPHAPLKFKNFDLAPPLLEALAEEGYETPTPIQAQAIPLVLQGKDLLGLAQTGTGKTAAFALPVLDHFLKNPRPFTRKGPRCLVLTPTRELALQVAENFSTYSKKTKLHTAVVFGGVGIEPQKSALRRKPDILVATPGRLLDLMQQGECNLSEVGVFVLDEADRMFDMGFVRDIRKVIQHLPKRRQNLLFSATMPPEIEKLVREILVEPSRVEVTPVARTAETIDQTVYFVDSKSRVGLLAHLLKDVQRGIVFTKMKHVANRIAEQLVKQGIVADAFHSNKSQNARVRILGSFKAGQTAVLVATDIAARGLDVDDVELVVNYDLPDVPETYVHRIGRAGRAGKKGRALSLVDDEQFPLLRDIEKITKCQPAIVAGHPFQTEASVGLQTRHERSRESGHAQGGKIVSQPGAAGGRSGNGPRSSGGFRGSSGPREGSKPREGGGVKSDSRPARSTPRSPSASGGARPGIQSRSAPGGKTPAPSSGIRPVSKPK